jgi:arylsulfatase A-like enzyme
LVIVTDDQRASGTVTPLTMPVTRRWLRDGGTRFPNAFATTPLCCPSRASILTGQYAHNHGVMSNSAGPTGAQALDQDLTVQRALDDAGYRSGLMGKFLNQWDVNVPPDHFDDYALMARHGYRDTPFNVNGEVRTIRRHSTEFVADRAVRFINRAEETDATPWFLYVAPHAPHLSAQPDAVEEKYQDARVGKWDGNSAVFEKDRRDKPPYVQDSDVSFKGGRNRRAEQLRLLMSVDDLVHDVAAALGRNNERSNTLAFFLSDNGFLWGEHRLGGKGVPYTSSIRIPLS